ncbi:MAG: hydroxyisourate hydrolase [Pseudonocardiales bacterium]|nr:MAG: hydroxyisourate hydrolase [Pseudonocardiales bacterium]
MSAVTTHVLDTSRGHPAAGLAVRLVGPDGTTLGQARTDDDGRALDLGPDRLDPADYRLVFDTGGYFDRLGTSSLYPEVSVTFTVTGAGHYHVPLLLSAYGYSTYRGS